MSKNDFLGKRLEVSSEKSFLLLGQSWDSSKDATAASDINCFMTVNARLLNIFLDQSTIKHPLCQDCADFIYDKMHAQLLQTKDEVELYRKHEQLLKESNDSKSKEKIDEQLEAIEMQLIQLKIEEASLLEQLSDVNEEQARLDKKIQEQNDELANLEKEEEKFYREYNSITKLVLELADEFTSLNNQIDYSNIQWKSLENARVFNIAFHIWYCGQFGTINGFRLGRLPNITVEWSEINAAWGQSALLLHCLAKKLSFTFKDYRVVPYGNYSFIESLNEEPKELPLYNNGGFKFMWNTKFDLAMVAFINCLQQLIENIKKVDHKFYVPYEVENDKIENTSNNSYSIKIISNSEEGWTKALKYMLTNLKWALTWISSNT